MGPPMMKVKGPKTIKPTSVPITRQLKVTAFFKKPSIVTSGKQNPPVGNDSIESDKSGTLSTSKLSSAQDSDDECQEIYCSPEFEAKLRPREESVTEPSRRKFTEEDFAETFNYNEESVYDVTKSKERRKCPFYKRIPFTKICVDAFNFAKEPEVLKHYFLSHFHADHYVGLSKGFSYPIYCSPITARLIRHKFKTSPKYLKTYENNIPFYVDEVRCLFYDANHCPGAVIILFELPNGRRYLHTGDFRACPEMELHQEIKKGPIDYCFLDTTFCDTAKTFPPQEQVLNDAVSVCRYALERSPRTLIVCGSYCIGKEKVFMAIAEALELKVWCNKYKRGYFACLQNEKLNSMLVDEPTEAKIHVLPLKSLWARGMRAYLDSMGGYFDHVVALRPSGWEYKHNKHMRPQCEGNIAIYPVPYSEHSSYTDLERFTKWLRPRRIIPTVNMGDPVKRGQMNHIFKRWLQAPLVQTSKPTNAHPSTIRPHPLGFERVEDSERKE